MRTRRILLLCSALGLIMMACQVILTGTTVPPTPTNPPLATPTSIPKIIPTSIPTSIPASLPTSIPTSGPTPTIVLTLPFLDDFSVDTNAWPIGSYPGEYADSTYEIVSGVYRVTTQSHKSAFMTAWPDLPSLSDFTLTVDAQLTSGNPDDSDYGVIYRSSDGERKYFFALNKYSYGVFLYDKTNGWQDVIAWTDGYGILPGKVNHIKVVLANGHYAFSVNGNRLYSFSDDRIPSGQLGLGVELFSAGETSVVEYDNFSVTNP